MKPTGGKHVSQEAFHLCLPVGSITAILTAGCGRSGRLLAQT